MKNQIPKNRCARMVFVVRDEMLYMVGYISDVQNTKKKRNELINDCYQQRRKGNYQQGVPKGSYRANHETEVKEASLLLRRVKTGYESY